MRSIEQLNLLDSTVYNRIRVPTYAGLVPSSSLDSKLIACKDESRLMAKSIDAESEANKAATHFVIVVDANKPAAGAPNPVDVKSTAPPTNDVKAATTVQQNAASPKLNKNPIPVAQMPLLPFDGVESETDDVEKTRSQRTQMSAWQKFVALWS
jgi:hypothetical protein